LAAFSVYIQFSRSFQFALRPAKSSASYFTVKPIQKTAAFKTLDWDQHDHIKIYAKKKSKDALDESVQKKLVSETLAPYRPLRLFLYGALGSGAAVGGLITLSGVAAVLSGARTDLDLNTEVSLFYSMQCFI
jgi:hypothetical protein